MTTSRTIAIQVPHTSRRTRALWLCAAAALVALTALLLAGCLAEEGNPAAVPTNPTFNTVANIMWDPSPNHCGSCHPPAGSGPATTVLDYAALLANTSTCGGTGGVTSMIVPGNRTASCLNYMVTQGGMKSYLSATQAETIGLWIDQGANP